MSKFDTHLEIVRGDEQEIHFTFVDDDGEVLEGDLFISVRTWVGRKTDLEFTVNIHKTGGDIYGRVSVPGVEAVI